jgi:hypothetical protein
MSYGDLWKPRPLFPSIEPMSTAIVRIYTSEGFVIAAEGRKFDDQKRIVVSDVVQKIFPLCEGATTLAYTIGGTVELTPKGSSEIVYDRASVVHKAIRNLTPSKIKSLWHFGEALSKAVGDLPDQAKSVLLGTEPELIVSFDGYYNGRAKRAHVKLFYDDKSQKYRQSRFKQEFR